VNWDNLAHKKGRVLGSETVMNARVSVRGGKFLDQLIYHVLTDSSTANKMIYMSLLYTRLGRDSSVIVANRSGLNGPGIESRSGRDFSHPSRSSLPCNG
jgi:hypothetical protein